MFSFANKLFILLIFIFWGRNWAVHECNGLRSFGTFYTFLSSRMILGRQPLSFFAIITDHVDISNSLCMSHNNLLIISTLLSRFCRTFILLVNFNLCEEIFSNKHFLFESSRLNGPFLEWVFIIKDVRGLNFWALWCCMGVWVWTWLYYRRWLIQHQALAW